jgi:hypothetical protein
MLPLAETQAAIAKAITSGSSADLPDSLFGDSAGNRRFRIHLRHYQASLTAALMQKFPATQWLVGAELFTRLALKYVQASAPGTPCIAEYGVDFPVFLANQGSTARWAYIEALAQLDWLLGKASIALDEPPVRWSEISALGPEALVDTRLHLQPGMRFLKARHPVDDIIRSYLADKNPPSGRVPAAGTSIEVRGSRGTYSLARIDPSEFAFRFALYSRLPVGEAASAAIETDPSFDAGRALRTLADKGYITATELVS